MDWACMTPWASSPWIQVSTCSSFDRKMAQHAFLCHHPVSRVFGTPDTAVVAQASASFAVGKGRTAWQCTCADSAASIRVPICAGAEFYGYDLAAGALPPLNMASHLGLDGMPLARVSTSLTAGLGGLPMRQRRRKPMPERLAAMSPAMKALLPGGAGGSGGGAAARAAAATATPTASAAAAAAAAALSPGLLGSPGFFQVNCCRAIPLLHSTAIQPLGCDASMPSLRSGLPQAAFRFVLLPLLSDPDPLQLGTGSTLGTSSRQHTRQHTRHKQQAAA